MVERLPRDYFKKHSALADWLTPARSEDREAIVGEERSRSYRLDLLERHAGLPTLGTTAFSGEVVLARTDDVAAFLRAAEGPYAVRLVPYGEGRVYRNRNLPVDELVAWAKTAVGEPTAYTWEFSPHVPNEWATIFVVVDHGIIGEVTRGSLRQLTQAERTSDGTAVYTYDFDEWIITPPDADYRVLAEMATQFACISNTETQADLERLIGCEFTNDYLKGYFEAIVGPTQEVRFIDFNISLGRRLDDRYLGIIRNQQQQDTTTTVHGTTASTGSAIGRARVVIDPSDPIELFSGEILICAETSPNMVPALANAAGVATDLGGVLSHASIVCRELGIPCIVGTHNATERVPDGVRVHLNADDGIIEILN